MHRFIPARSAVLPCVAIIRNSSTYSMFHSAHLIEMKNVANIKSFMKIKFTKKVNKGCLVQEIFTYQNISSASK